MTARTKETRKLYSSTMPKKRRHYTYETLKTFTVAVVRQIAQDWYDIDTNNLSQPKLIERIVERQDQET